MLRQDGYLMRGSARSCIRWKDQIEEALSSIWCNQLKYHVLVSYSKNNIYLKLILVFSLIYKFANHTIYFTFYLLMRIASESF